MKIKNYLIIFCLFMVLMCCVGAISAATDDAMNDKVSEIESVDGSISLNDDNQVLGVDSRFALSAQGANDDEILAQTLEGDNSSNTILSKSGEVEYYVSIEGNDENTGAQDSPFATIAKAISLADASNNTIVYIGEGRFTGEGNTNLAINLDNLNNGGSLTFIGVDGKTIIDGENQNRFISSINQNSLVIIENIYINNTQAPAYGAGGAIFGLGSLTVDNCVFENIYAPSSGGTIWIVCQSGDLKVSNSVFKNSHSNNNYGGAIYGNALNVEIINNTFDNCNCINTVRGAAIYSTANGNSSIKGNKFYNITTDGSSYDAGLYSTSNGNSEITDNTFVNCHNLGTAYAVIYIGADFVSGNKFINSSSKSKGLIYATKSFNFVINISDVETKGRMFTLTSNVTDVDGNSITFNNNINYYVDGENVGSSRVTDGTLTLSMIKLYDNGEYNISCGLSSVNVMPTINNGTLTVNIDRTPMDLWVDAENGEDVETAGSESNPYKSISYAISQASLNATIHLKNGIYKGENNTNIIITAFSLTIVGEDKDKTIIDGENQNRFISSIYQDSVVIIENIYINNTRGDYNGGGAINGEGNLTVDNCVFENTYVASNGGAIKITRPSSADLKVSNSVFKNTHVSDFNVGGAIYASALNVEIINNIFVDCNCGQDGQGAAIYSSANGNSSIKGNKFYNITTDGYSYDAGLYSTSNGNSEITDNTFVNCHNLGTQYAVMYISADYVFGNKFINSSSASKGLIYATKSFNFIINISDVETTGPSFTLTSNVTDVDGNSITFNNNINYYVDGENVGSSRVTDGTLTLTVAKFYDNGEYSISCELPNSISGNVMPIINNGTLSVNMDRTPMDLWVDAENGEDVETAGSESNPFKSIAYAISQASLNATIHLKEGTYKGENNTNITINTLSLAIVGEGKDKTIIDGENTNYFFDISNGDIIFSNLTFVKGFFVKVGRYNYCIGVSSTSSLLLDNIKYENNTEISSSNYYGIRAQGLLTINNSEFNNNGKDKGLCVVFAPNTIISNSTFVNNAALRGIIYINRGVANVTSSQFIDNNATCIWSDVTGGGASYVDGCNFTNNHALNTNGPNGGAIYTYMGNISNCIFTDNSAYSYGGAIYIRSGEISNCKFYDNSAPTISTNGGGGAIYVANNNKGLTLIKNCYFEGNKALTASGMNCGGGAIFTIGTTSVVSSTFINNSAVQRGGAIRNGVGYSDNNLTVRDSIFIDNTAGSNGGAISSYLDPSQYAVSGYNYIYSSTFINNTAGVDGGAIETYRTSLNMDGCSFEENKAISGGAIKAGYIIIISNSNFTKNHAESSGGAITGGATPKISKSIFVGNDAPTGAAIEGAGLTLSYSVLVNNTDLQGTALFVTNPADLENNWWGCNDDPNQFIGGSEYEIASWAVANALPEITDIQPGDNITVYFTDNNGNELEDTIPVRQVIVDDDSYDLINNTVTIVAERTGTMTLCVDNEAFEYSVRIPTSIDVENDTLDLKVNDEVATGATLTPADAGNLTYTSSNNGVARVENGKIIAVGEGTAVITVSFAGNDDYTAAENKTIAVTVSLNDASVRVNNDTLDLSATDTFALVPVTSPEGLTVSYASSDESVATVDENGLVTAVSQGSATITVSVGGDGAYVFNSTEVSVTVAKINTTLSIPDIAIYNANNNVVATLTDINGNPVKGVNVKVTVGSLGKTLKTDENGQVSLNVSSLDEGKYKVTVKSATTGVYNWAPQVTATAYISEGKVNTTLTVQDVAIYNADNPKVIATLKDIYGNAIKGINVKVTVGSLAKTLKTDANGQVALDISSLEDGAYQVTVKSASSAIYNWAPQVTALAYVGDAKVDTVLEVPNVATVAGTGTVVATLKDIYGNAIKGVNVKITVGTLAKTLKTDENGQVSLDISSLAPGNYTVTVKSASSSVYNWASQVKATAIVCEGKIDTVLSADDVVTTHNSGDKIVATLKDIAGNAIKGLNVKISVGSIAKTMKTDANGQVALDVSTLAPGSYTATIKSASSSIYNNAAQTRANVTIES